MAKLTRKEFAALCHTSTGSIGVYISRKQIIEEEDRNGKFIDTENEKNRLFFNKRQTKFEAEKVGPGAVKKPPKKTTVKVPKKEATEETPKKKQTPKKPAKGKRKSILPDFDPNDNSYSEDMEWESRKKKADAILQEARAEKEQLAVQKLAGQLLPIDMVLSIMQTHNREIFATFQNDTENLASIYCDILAGGDRKKLAALNKKLAEKLEDTIRRAGDVAKASIDNLVEQYRQTRNRGERK